MTVKLTKELVAALHATGEGELEVVNSETRDSIAQDIAEMEAGEGISIEMLVDLRESDFWLKDRTKNPQRFG